MILVINSSNHISADKRTLGYGFLFAFYSKYCRKFGERCFSHAGPAAWNTLPDSIKLIIDTNRFKSLLTTHLFQLAF